MLVVSGFIELFAHPLVKDSYTEDAEKLAKIVKIR